MDRWLEEGTFQKKNEYFKHSCINETRKEDAEVVEVKYEEL
jgi:hypothetical protein